MVAHRSISVFGNDRVLSLKPFRLSKIISHLVNLSVDQSSLDKQRRAELVFSGISEPDIPVRDTESNHDLVSERRWP